MWKIIIVEDEQPILELNTRLLEKYGAFQVVDSFLSPLEALEKLPKYEIDAILLDIEMPRMNGIELARKLVDIGIDVPIIFSTAYPQYAVEAFRVQALDYILKPITPNTVKELDERLQKYYGVMPQKKTADHLLVQLYGNPFVKKEDQTVKWRTRVTEELFYYFLLNEGKVVSKWRILEDIWPNIAEKRALANLYNTIYHMRQLFAELDVPIVLDRVNNGYEMKQNEAIKFLPPHSEDECLLESKGYLWAYQLQ
ncbi:response regulator receiver protein [Bacillaceae bacterium SAOS 7]|nr:response regulator receiver protein [Bacillaceae bacterium SAOS 7]